jgi:hypothetical protein
VKGAPVRARKRALCNCARPREVSPGALAVDVHTSIDGVGGGGEVEKAQLQSVKITIRAA